ncbi:hypothetical protein F5Y18DRAFT_156794 [Xylariaceae sp. FL1019]|nr:hypothetical protein F5Y18DRAFT_156794 [Xylariaceae sp. FL1019]
MQPRTRPIQKFAIAVSKCSAEASIYGKCIVADYNSVHKDKCAAEFMKLKDCYLVRARTHTESTLHLSVTDHFARNTPKQGDPSYVLYRQSNRPTTARRVLHVKIREARQDNK